MPFVVRLGLGTIGSAFIPGVEVLAAALVRLTLAPVAVTAWTGQTADVPAGLGLGVVALLVRFFLLRVAARLR